MRHFHRYYSSACCENLVQQQDSYYSSRVLCYNRKKIFAFSFKLHSRTMLQTSRYRLYGGCFVDVAMEDGWMKVETRDGNAVWVG